MEPGSAKRIQALIVALNERHRAGRLDGCELEYWHGGGMPPPYYKSVQFRLLELDGQDTLELDIMKFDRRLTPEDYIEKYQLPARPEDIRAVLLPLIESRAFESQFPEEEGEAPDRMSTEVIVWLRRQPTPDGSHADLEFLKRYRAGLPAALEPLRAEVERLTRLVQAEGKRGFFQKGLPIELPEKPG